MFFILVIIIILVIIYYQNIHLYISNLYIKIFNQNDIGNKLCGYFYNYTLSICNKKNFNYKIYNRIDDKFFSLLPSYIPFNLDLYNKFQENNITLNIILSKKINALWYCDDEIIYKLWKILRPVINKILNDVNKKNGLHTIIKHPIIHFRCADVPFIKNPKYYLQKLYFFKRALETFNFNNDRTVIIMFYFNHKSGDENKIACSLYLKILTDYLTNLGYNYKFQSKSSIEDFFDLFNAPFVISTGGSFSFMSGFFGNGKFISTEHCSENYDCCKTCDESFLKGYNIHHKYINSYYNVDYIHKNYLQ